MADDRTRADSNNLSEEIGVAELRQWLKSDRNVALLDVREQYERDAALIEGSQHIPLMRIPAQFTTEFPDPEREIVIYCEHGNRSLDACRYLRQKGYRRVWSLAGGIVEWNETAAPSAAPDSVFAERYHRQIRLPEVGPEGQAKLAAARVLIVGAGGLGSPAALYLASAGAGTLGIVDFDTVDASNLHRQILYTESDLGRSKAEIAAARVRAANSHIEVIPLSERLSAANAERILEAYDIVLDGSDNFATRYLINDVCAMLRKPNVHGSVQRFEGQVTVYCADGGPCYRCLYPTPPESGLVPACADTGVLGVLPGVIGTLQATEAIKLILGEGEPLVGRILHFDALQMAFTTFATDRRNDCAYCNPDLPFPGLADYESSCGP